jgi:Na+/phosphate symporter
MMIEMGISGVICIAGALIYAFAANNKLQEIGRIMFFCGLFVSLLGLHAVARIR